MHPDDRDIPRGKIWLVANGKRYLLTDDPIGACSITKRSEYKQRQIPKHALSAYSAWWAGCGEDVYVIFESGRLLVFRRQYSDGEGRPEIPPYSLFKTIHFDESS